jgi:hypothetical protein
MKKDISSIRDDIRRQIQQCVGERCCRTYISKTRGLFLGFGDLIQSRSAIGEYDHGKWELGTYYGSWRIIQGQELICGSQDLTESVEELREQLKHVTWGSFFRLQQLTEFDVRLELSNGILVDVLGTFSENDELLHLFCPDQYVITFSIADGWEMGPSTKPWPPVQDAHQDE